MTTKGASPRWPATLAVFATAVLVIAACGSNSSDGAIEEARPASASAVGSGPAVVKPAGETDPVPHGGDAADDPAIYVNRSSPRASLIIGTNKDGGIAVYTLAGRQVQYRADGEINNVDLRSGFPLGGRKVTLVTAGNKSDNSVAIYRLDTRRGKLIDVAARRIRLGVEAHGWCMYRSPTTRKTYFIANQGRAEQWELFDDGGGRVDARRVRSFEIGGDTEGCVADDELQRLYVGEEGRGIWRYGAEPGAGTARVRIDSTGSAGHLVADVEGLAIAYGAGHGGYLIASSQGNNSFVVYERGGSNRYAWTFEIRDGRRVDGVEDTDGIDVATAALGPGLRQGLLVAQDGSNDRGNQNFKLVPWRNRLG